MKEPLPWEWPKGYAWWEPKPHRCHMCQAWTEIREQLCGFWFCRLCLPKAKEIGACVWRQVYRRLYPWRFETGE